MSDYINREAAIALLKKWADGYSYIETPTEDAINEFNAIPAADVQPVVYCKDCTLSRENGFFCTSTFHGGMTFPNDFCSSGERRGAKMGGDT